ncbi:uncharacterized protein BN818_00408 [Clostridium sp. CAG:964]|nr:uncharacterized protein BN818_00408 [Clostridium sp. CAG:964]
MPKRSKKEFLQKMNEQLLLLEEFSNNYDEGKLIYATEMAVKLRVLFGTRDNPKDALLEQFCKIFIENKPDFLNDAIYPINMPLENESKFVRCNLCQYQLTHAEDSSIFLYPVPIKSDKHKYNAFNTWWRKTTAISLGASEIENNILFRSDVVTLIANKEGAHVSPEISKSMALLNRNEANPLKIDINGKIYSAKLDEIFSATIRQIVYETLITLKPFVSKVEGKYMFQNNS